MGPARVACFASALFVLLALPAAHSQGGAAGRPVQVPKDFLGLTIHRPFKLHEWPAIGFSSLRLWDNHLRWTDLQPRRDTWRWEAFDAYVDLASGRGKELIYTLGQTPRWASSRPDDRQVYGEGAAAMPADLDDWRAYVEAVASRYRGRIAAYEIWNEPMEPDAAGLCRGNVFFCGSVADLVQLAAVAHGAIKRHDAAAIVATPAFDRGMQGADKLDRYLAAGGHRYTEAVSFHFYQLEPEEIWTVAARLRQVMVRHGLGHVPLWNTESGFLVQDSAGRVQRQQDSGPFSRVFTPEQAGARTARAMIVAASAGIDRFVFYAWDNGRMGALDAVSGKPTALARSMEVTRRWLVGATLSCRRDGRVADFSCAVQGGGRQARLLWNGDRASNSRLDADALGGWVRIGLLDGSERELAPGESMSWDGSPVRVAFVEQTR